MFLEVDKIVGISHFNEKRKLKIIINTNYIYSISPTLTNGRDVLTTTIILIKESNITETIIVDTPYIDIKKLLKEKLLVV
jgi:hypothetical protein